MYDYPELGSVKEYENFARNIFSKPDIIIKDVKNGEMLYIKGKGFTENNI